jgi:rhodanese-related sulfurtransferase
MKTKSNLLQLAMLLFFVSASLHSTAQNSTKANLTVTEAFELVKKGAVLIDVREPSEVQEQAYHVNNILRIPLGSLEQKLAEIPKDKQLVLACRSGGRSQEAYNTLQKLGYTNIANMDGGMMAWEKAGLPVVKASAPQPDQAPKACCANPSGKKCNPDGTCKKPEETKGKQCCSDKGKGKKKAKACCATH